MRLPLKKTKIVHLEELEAILQEHAQLRAKNAKLEDEQQGDFAKEKQPDLGFIRRETEYERVLKARNDWDMLEGTSNLLFLLKNVRF